MSREMQSLLLKLFPENPMAPALQKGAQGLLEATDFISQRQFERTALYNEIMRPNGVRYHLLIPLQTARTHRRDQRKSSLAIFRGRNETTAAFHSPSCARPRRRSDNHKTPNSGVGCAVRGTPV